MIFTEIDGKREIRERENITALESMSLSLVSTVRSQSIIIQPWEVETPPPPPVLVCGGEILLGHWKHETSDHFRSIRFFSCWNQRTVF